MCKGTRAQVSSLLLTLDISDPRLNAGPKARNVNALPLLRMPCGAPLPSRAARGRWSPHGRVWQLRGTLGLSGASWRFYGTYS